MSEQDYSKMKGIADEPHWRQFVQSVGGELIDALITRPGIKNADFLFRSSNVIAELKIFETEFAHTEQALAKVDAAIAKYPNADPENPREPLRDALLKIISDPIQRVVKKANRQIKETKAELQMPEARGVLVCINDNFRGVPPGLVIGSIGKILSGPSYKSITAAIYLTNHYIELDESPYALLLWSPMYSDEAGDDLVDFINDLGRKWRVFAESIDGPYDVSEERESVDLSRSSVVDGPRRNREYRGD